MFTHVLSISKKACHRDPRGNFLGVLPGYGVDGRQVIVFSIGNSVPVSGEIKSQGFTVIGFPLLSPLLFIAHMDWLDRHSGVDGFVTAGSCRVNGLLLAFDDLILLASSEQHIKTCT